MSSSSKEDYLESKIDWQRIIFMLLGITLFAVIYYIPTLPDAVDPAGKHFVLTREGKGALAVFPFSRYLVGV